MVKKKHEQGSQEKVAKIFTEMIFFSQTLYNNREPYT